jgi:hypothetical protein
MAVVTVAWGMPVADQEVIRATIHQVLQERDQ